ncbi:DNA methyltransferase [Bifidobacterium stellenboschense]|nr:DNA methyltransferase [Bifidobacterium stellenboschense]
MADELRMRAGAFVERWRGRGDENSETQQFWMDLLGDVLHVDRLSDRQVLWFERRTAGNGLIDVLMVEARVLVEQKSLGVDLDKEEPRQGVMKTPVRQALDYANALPPSERPVVLITCNFGVFRLYDLESDPLAKAPRSEFALEELPDHVGELAGLFDRGRSRTIVQQQLSEKAGQLGARLHDALASCYDDPDEAKAHDDLAMLTVRIVFCLYAEDAGLFPANSFRDLVKASDPRHLRGDIEDLFDVLDTPEDGRSKYLDAALACFPYVDGGLFRDQIEIPPMGRDIQDALMEISEGFDWSGISPVIFGSLMEETLSHDERRRGGMHYTSVTNIHRLIDPLFLDGLTAECDRLIAARPAVEKGRAFKEWRQGLQDYQDRLAGLKWADFAAGSGNFLTETFICVRRLENRIIEALQGDQIAFDMEGFSVKVSIAQMYGVEINGFACAVARTALWIAEQQMLDETESVSGRGLDRLPFKDSGNIVQANALRYDWNDLLPGDECDYVMGNPPFLGHISKTPEQTGDLKAVWGGDYDGYLDYATGWFRKASRYLTKPSAAFALVSTNSITQGQPVPHLFGPIMADGWRIAFAHRTFAWNAQSTDNAHVHVVIIGMDRADDATKPPILFEYPDIDGEPEATHPRHVNGYLLDGPDVYAEKRSQKVGPLSPMLGRVDFGSMPLDGGNLLINDADEYAKAMGDPIAAKYVRPFRMGRELINGIERWCLWLADAPASDILKSPYLKTRVEAVKSFREQSKRAATRERAATPQLFGENHQPEEAYLAIPKVFSGRRRWATCALLGPEVIAGDQVFTTGDAEGFAFSIIESSMFITWQKTIGGQMKSDCRFSNTVVWNTLPLPKLSDAMRGKVIEAGRGVIEARANHPGESLADLYNPLLMHPDLLKAHERLDRIVDVAFGAGRPCGSDDERLQILFDRYQDLTKV